MASVTGGDKLKAALDKIAGGLSKRIVLNVGFLEGATYPDGTSVPLVAAMNEFGHGIGRTPLKGELDDRDRVPPRPFFRNMVRDKKGEWPGAVALALKAKRYDAEAALRLVGEGIVGQLKQAINEFSSVPLRPSTIKRKGFAKQLIDTSVMLNSVDFEIES